MDEDRAAFREFGRLWVRQERELFLTGRPHDPRRLAGIWAESRRLLRVPRFRPPLRRMLARVATILTRAKAAR